MARNSLHSAPPEGRNRAATEQPAPHHHPHISEGHANHVYGGAHGAAMSSSLDRAASLAAAYVALPWRARLPGAVADCERELARRFVSQARAAIRESRNSETAAAARRAADIAGAMRSINCGVELSEAAIIAAATLGAAASVARVSIDGINSRLTLRNASGALAARHQPPIIALASGGVERLLTSISLSGVSVELAGLCVCVPRIRPLLQVARVAIGADAFVGLLKPPSKAAAVPALPDSPDVDRQLSVHSEQSYFPPNATVRTLSTVCTAGFTRLLPRLIQARSWSPMDHASSRSAQAPSAPAQNPAPDDSARSMAPLRAIDLPPLAILWLRAALMLRIHGLHAHADAHALPALSDAAVILRGCSPSRRPHGSATASSSSSSSGADSQAGGDLAGVKGTGGIAWACTPTVDSQVLLTDVSFRLRAADYAPPPPRDGEADQQRSPRVSLMRTGALDATSAVPPVPPSLLVSLRSLSLWVNNNPHRHATNVVESTPTPSNERLPLPPALPQSHLHVSKGLVFPFSPLNLGSFLVPPTFRYLRASLALGSAGCAFCLFRPLAGHSQGIHSCLRICLVFARPCGWSREAHGEDQMRLSRFLPIGPCTHLR